MLTMGVLIYYINSFIKKLLNPEVLVKEKIHPKYEDVTFTCSCGNVIETRSTIKSTHIDICSKCHPFYTGKQKLIDSAGRVERFQKRYAVSNKEA